MGDLTKDFSRREFACKGASCCGHSAPISTVLAHGLQTLRDDLSALIGEDVIIIVTNGFRCLTHNREIGSSDDSQHPLGLAADIIAPLAGPDLIEEVAERIPEFDHGGIGRYTRARAQMVHLDVRGERARWTE